jgi:glycosyltransferase involved in cell wall biosynthesis
VIRLIRKIVFYNDSAVYGGHEAMFLSGLSSIIKKHGLLVYIYYSKYNTRLAYEIKKLTEGRGNVILLPLDIRSRSFQAVSSFFMRRTVSKLARRFKSICPERVIVIQGNIEISSLGLLAAKKAGCHCISYIPMVNTMASARNHFLGMIKYPFVSMLFRKPDRFITITNSIAGEIRRRAGKTPVDVVYNCVDYSRYKVFPKEEARKIIGLPLKIKCIGIIGRIMFAQKGHDLLVNFVKSKRDELGDILFVVVGSGSDEEKLRRRVSRYDLEKFFEFIPWTDKLSEVYSSLDALILPSRYEGVPIVAIEALKFGIPILVSYSVFSLKNILPGYFFFKQGNYDDLLSLLNELPSCGSKTYAKLRRLFSIKKFPHEFTEAVLR